MARNGIFPPSFKMSLKTRYPLLVQQQPPAVSPPSDNSSFPLQLPRTEPKSLGNDHIESGSLEALADDQEKEQKGIPLAARLDDLAGNTSRQAKRNPAGYTCLQGSRARWSPSASSRHA